MSKTPPPDVATPTAPDDDPGARTAIRESMLLMATLTGVGIKGELKARVRNLAAGGMMVELATRLDVGQAVHVSLPRIGDRMAVVAWMSDGRVGFRFDDPVDPSQARRPIGGGEGSPAYAKSLTVGPRALRVR